MGRKVPSKQLVQLNFTQIDRGNKLAFHSSTGCNRGFFVNSWEIHWRKKASKFTFLWPSWNRFVFDQRSSWVNQICLGKTSTIVACARQMYGKFYKSMVLEVCFCCIFLSLILNKLAECLWWKRNWSSSTDY